jgi:hypothetical protein
MHLRPRHSSYRLLNQVITVGAHRDGRIISGLVTAVAAGLATTVLYALTAAAYFAYPVDTLLRWSLLPVVPIAAIAALAAALT